MPQPLNPAARFTARMASVRRKLTGARRRRMPRQEYPRLIEAEYAARIVRIGEPVRAAVRELLPELKALVQSAQRERMDAGEGERMRRLLERAQEAVARSARTNDVEQIARLFAQRTETFQRVQLGRQVRAALGADVFATDRRIPALVDQFVAENVALIKSIPQVMFADVEKTATRAFTSGTTPDELTEQIQERFEVSESRARLIARDQIGKLNGQVNAYRQQDLGIDSYIWRTAGDERVREEHERLDGREFRWDDPPDEGHPGEPIQCRCYAEPVMRSIVEGEDAP